ncbi:MAG: protein kinase [Terracidiphilus sp.]
MDPIGNKPSGEITHIGKYEIIDVLGRGGMGVVYRGIDKQIGREVAIKTLTQGFSGDENMLARFYEEGRRTGRLNHPNIVIVYDLGDDNGTPYIVMERVAGQPLDKLIRPGADPELSMADRLGVLKETCEALGYAHRNNVIHRDVKPANIFVQPDGTAKLLDFGIARLEKREGDQGLTRTGHLIGTVPYMSPERLRNEPIDGRSDIFAAGVVLFQLVTGQLPFSGADNVLMSKILNEPAPRLDSIRSGLPPSLELIVDRALAKNLDDRYPTAEEMAADLASVIVEFHQEEVQELLPEARRLMEADELTRARTVLHQLQKIDSKNAEAKTMLAEIQRQLAQRAKEERIQQIRLQAEDAISHNRFDQSLSVLDSGLELDSANPELVKLRERAQQEKEKADKINEFMQQAETARRKGDFKNAIAAAKKALSVDKTNPRIVALSNSLSKEAEQAERHAKAKSMLDSARGEISFRRFNEALELLKKVEDVDPTNPELPLLMGDANSGLEQIKRKESVAKLEEEVAQAVSYEQLQEVAKSVQAAMVAMPTEAALYRLNTQVERQIKEHENRILVDETVQACRNLRPREALELVRKARLRLPGEEKLLNMEALLADRLRQQSVDDRRADYIARARESLEKKQHSEAVRVLELCQAEGIATGEILSLLDFARAEEQEYHKQEQLRAQLDQAQALMHDAAYDEAINFLEVALQQADDTALHLLLDQAAAGRDSLRQQIENVLASAVSLVQVGKRDEALEFLRNQPAAVLRSPRVQSSLEALEEERAQALFRTLGRAYSALGSDLPAGEAVMRRAVVASVHTTLFVEMGDAYHARGQAFADQVVTEAVENAKNLIRDHNRDGAGQALQSVSGLVDYATAEVKAEWNTAQRKASQTSMFSRLRS